MYQKINEIKNEEGKIWLMDGIYIDEMKWPK